MLFDWLTYETFLTIVYEKSPKDEFDINEVGSFDPEPFQKFLKEWHSKSYLDN
jgi:hypothetical protein